MQRLMIQKYKYIQINYLVRTVHPHSKKKIPKKPQTTMPFSTWTSTQLLAFSGQTWCIFYTVFFPSQVRFPVTKECTREEARHEVAWDILYMLSPHLFDSSLFLYVHKFPRSTTKHVPAKQDDHFRLSYFCFWSNIPFSPLTSCIPTCRIYKVTSALHMTEDILKTGAENECPFLLPEQTAIFVEVLRQKQYMWIENSQMDRSSCKIKTIWTEKTGTAWNCSEFVLR